MVQPLKLSAESAIASRVKLKFKLVTLFAFFILIDCAITYSLFLSGVTPLHCILFFVILGSGGFFLSYTKMRSYFVSPFDLASMFVEKLTENHFDIELPNLNEPEANRLMNALNKLTKQLKGKEETISKLEHMRIDFVANVSHELKTPLTSIKGYIETLKHSVNVDNETRQKFLERVESNANRLEALISDLLALSKLEKAGAEVQWEIFDTQIFTDKLDAIFLPSLNRKKQQLKFEFSDAKLEGDRLKFDQVFNNLIENACRYTPENTLIKVKQTRDDQAWHYEVSDNGPGISGEHLPRIFERFYRVTPDRNRESGGTGLGLAIVKHAISLHGGTIEVRSKVGQGTSFLFSIPRHSL
jgi:signal transduction histidine kinase